MSVITAPMAPPALRATSLRGVREGEDNLLRRMLAQAGLVHLDAPAGGHWAGL